MRNWWAVLIGFGIAISPIHNQWLTKLVSKDDVVGFFLPAFGYAIIIIAVLMYLTWRYDWKHIDWGAKQVYIPLIAVSVAIGLSGITAETIQNRLSPLLFGIVLFGVYLVARKLGQDIFMPLAVGALIASVGIFISAIIKPGEVTGGLIFERNYDVVVGYVLLGAVAFINRYQWALLGVAFLAMLLSGSPEGLFVTGVMGVIFLARRDWNDKFFIGVSAAVLVIGLWITIGNGQALYKYVAEVSSMQPTIEPYAYENAPSLTALGYRVGIAKEAMQNIKPLGHGYNITGFYEGIVHNVPLIIVQELGWPGILAGLAWLWVSIYCLIKTKYKYAWALILSLSIFDHYIWTQLAPIWWSLAGISTASSIKRDLIFREV